MKETYKSDPPLERVKETYKRGPNMWKRPTKVTAMKRFWKAARCLIHSPLPHMWLSFVVSLTCERNLQKRPEYVKETDKSHCGEYALASSAYVGLFCRSLSLVKETYKSHCGEYALVSSTYMGRGGVFCSFFHM